MSSIETAQDLLAMGDNFLEAQMRSDTSQEDVAQWAQSFFQTIETVAENQSVVPQAVVRAR